MVRSPNTGIVPGPTRTASATWVAVAPWSPGATSGPTAPPLPLELSPGQSRRALRPGRLRPRGANQREQDRREREHRDQRDESDRTPPPAHHAHAGPLT